MLVWNEEWESPSKIAIFYWNWKDYFSFERSRKFFISNSIPTIFCMFSCYVHCAFEEIRFRVWHSLFIFLIVIDLNPSLACYCACCMCTITNPEGCIHSKRSQSNHKMQCDIVPCLLWKTILCILFIQIIISLQLYLFINDIDLAQI
jgi:hypothetical protein